MGFRETRLMSCWLSGNTYGGFPNLVVFFEGGPCNKDYSTLGFIRGPPVLQNYYMHMGIVRKPLSTILNRRKPSLTSFVKIHARAISAQARRKVGARVRKLSWYYSCCMMSLRENHCKPNCARTSSAQAPRKLRASSKPPIRDERIFPIYTCPLRQCPINPAPNYEFRSPEFPGYAPTYPYLFLVVLGACCLKIVKDVRFGCYPERETLHPSSLTPFHVPWAAGGCAVAAGRTHKTSAISSGLSHGLGVKF